MPAAVYRKVAVCRQCVKIPLKTERLLLLPKVKIKVGRPQRSKAPQLKKRKPQALLRRPRFSFYSNEAFRVFEVSAPTPSLKNEMTK